MESFLLYYKQLGITNSERRPIMKHILVFLAVFVVFTLFFFGGIQLDLLMNPWLRHVMQEWKWYNYFTSYHGVTVLYLKGWLWLIPSLVSSIIVVVAYRD